MSEALVERLAREACGVSKRALVLTLVGWTVLGAWVVWRDPLEALEPGDDWTSYEAIAQQILGGDWTGGPDLWKHGTLAYPYVVAGAHALLGPDRWPIYWLQYALAGVACVGMGVLGGPWALVGANVIALLDVARWYPTRLLSENLLLPLLPWTFVALRARRRGLAGIGLALIALTRLNLIPFALVAGGWLLAGSWSRLRDWSITAGLVAALLGMVWFFGRYCCP